MDSNIRLDQVDWGGQTVIEVRCDSCDQHLADLAFDGSRLEGLDNFNIPCTGPDGEELPLGVVFCDTCQASYGSGAS